MVSRDEMRYSTSGNDLNLKRNVNDYSDHTHKKHQNSDMLTCAHFTWWGEGENDRTYLLKDKITLRSLDKPSNSIGSDINRLFLKNNNKRH